MGEIPTIAADIKMTKMTVKMKGATKFSRNMFSYKQKRCYNFRTSETAMIKIFLFAEEKKL